MKDLNEYIKNNIIRLEATRRGGGIEIDASEYLDFPGAKLTAYQNYLGGGMLGSIQADRNFSITSNKVREAKTKELQEALKRYFHINNIIRGIDMVLMNNIPEVDPSVYENWLGDMPDSDIFQWFALGESDAEFLSRYNQYITYSDLLDTHFLAVTHFGTAWDYTSMVDDFNDLYHEED